MRITLPWDVLVSSNRKHITRKVLTTEYRDAKERAHFMAMAQVRKRPHYPSGDLQMALDFYVPDRRRRDVRNYCKLLADALEGVAYTDDYQVKRDIVTNRGKDEDPRVEITIQPLEAA